MVLQHAFLEILDIPENIFPGISDYVRNFLQKAPADLTSLCGCLNYTVSFISRWADFMEYRKNTGSIVNACRVYTHPMVFGVMLRTIVQELAESFPECSFRGAFRLFNSNWGYDTYPFRAEQGILTWDEETLARQQPEIRKFWNAMRTANYTDIPDLLTAMYAPMTDRQLYNAFGILEDLFFDPAREVTPVDAYDFDNEGTPERESMVEFTYNCFLDYCWENYADIWDFFRVIQEAFSRKNVPFNFPDEFLSAPNI
jgi:hypothetical protein